MITFLFAIYFHMLYNFYRLSMFGIYKREDFMKRVLSVLLTVILIATLVSCGGKKESDEPKKDNEKKEYVSDEEVSKVFSNPEKYKGKYIKLTGKIFNGPEREEDYVIYQAWNDIKNSENDFVFGLQSEDSYAADDYVTIDGMIAGVFSGENMMGGKISSPIINAENVEKLTYIDAVVPTISEITPENAILEQNCISLKVDKIEFAEKETRLYLTETNSSEYKFSMWKYDIKILQGGQQIEQDSSSSSVYQGEYPELSSEILPNASSSGIIVFPPIDSSSNIQIYADGHSDNYDVDFSPFVIDIVLQ